MTVSKLTNKLNEVWEKAITILSSEPTLEKSLDHFANPQTLTDASRQERSESSVTRLFGPSKDDFATLTLKEANDLEIMAENLGLEFNMANVTDRINELQRWLYEENLNEEDGAVNSEIELLFGACAAFKGALVEYHAAMKGVNLADPATVTAAKLELQVALELFNEFSISPSLETAEALNEAGSGAARYIETIRITNAIPEGIVNIVFSNDDLAIAAKVEDPLLRASAGLGLIEKFYESSEIPDIAKARPELILAKMSEAKILDAATLNKVGLGDLAKKLLRAGQRMQNKELILEDGIEEVKGSLSEAAFNISKKVRDGIWAHLEGALFATMDLDAGREEARQRYLNDRRIKDLNAKEVIITIGSMDGFRPRMIKDPRKEEKAVENEKRWNAEFEVSWEGYKNERKARWREAVHLASGAAGGLIDDIDSIEGTNSFSDLLDKQENVIKEVKTDGSRLFELVRCANVYLSGQELAENLGQDPGMRQVARVAVSEFKEKDFLRRLRKGAPIAGLTKKHIMAVRERMNEQITVFEKTAMVAEDWNGLARFYTTVGVIMLAASTGGAAAGAAADLGLATEGGIGAFFIDSTAFGLTDMALSGATPWDSYPKTWGEFTEKMVHTYAMFGALRGTGKVLGMLRGDAKLGWEIINDAGRFARLDVSAKEITKELRAVATALGGNVRTTDALVTDALQIINSHLTLQGANAALGAARIGEMPQGIGTWEDLLTLTILHYHGKTRDGRARTVKKERAKQRELSSQIVFESAARYLRWAATAPAYMFLGLGAIGAPPPPPSNGRASDVPDIFKAPSKFADSVLRALTVPMGVPAGTMPSLRDASVFLRSPGAALRIVAAYSHHNVDKFISSAMARFYESIIAPTAPASVEWMKALEKASSAQDFAQPLAMLANSIEARWAEMTVDQKVNGLLGYLGNGQDGITGKLSSKHKESVSFIFDALALSTAPEGLEAGLWREAVKKCANKWVRVYELTGEDLGSLGADGMDKLRRGLIEKLKALRGLGFHKTLLLSAVHRYSVDALIRVNNAYGIRILTHAISGSLPFLVARQIYEISEKIKAIMLQYPDDDIRRNALSIASAAIDRGVRESDKAEKFAISAIDACVAARDFATTHEDPDVRKIAATIMYIVAHRGIQGTAAGTEFARSVTAAYLAARAVAKTSQDQFVRQLSSVIANDVADRGFQGEEAGRKFATSVIEAYLAARGVAETHEDPAVKKIADEVAFHAINRGIQGSEAGKALSLSIIEAYYVARKRAEEHKEPGVQKNAATFASCTVAKGIRGDVAGKKHVESVIEAYLAVLNFMETHKNVNVRRIAETVASMAIHKNRQGKEAGKKFAESVIEAYNAGRDLAEKREDPNVRKNASSIAFALVHRQISGEKAGREFAASVIEAYLAARRVVETHGDPMVRRKVSTIAYPVIVNGIQGDEAGKKHVESVIAAYLAVRKKAEEHDDPVVRDRALAIATAAVNRRICGAEAVERLIEAYLGAYKAANAHEDQNVKRLAMGFAVTVALKGIQGTESGKKFAASMIEAYLAARKMAETHEDISIRNKAATIAGIVMGDGMRGEKAGRELAAAMIKTGQAVRKVVEAHSDPFVREIAETVIGSAISNHSRGEDSGREFAQAVIEAYLAARKVAETHNDPIVKAKVATIAIDIARRGIRGEKGGREAAEAIILKMTKPKE